MFESNMESRNIVLYWLSQLSFTFQLYVYLVHFRPLNICSSLYLNYFHIFNINFQHMKIHHMYTTNVQRNVYVLNIWLFYITLGVNESD